MKQANYIVEHNLHHPVINKSPDLSRRNRRRRRRKQIANGEKYAFVNVYEQLKAKGLYTSFGRIVSPCLCLCQEWTQIDVFVCVLVCATEGDTHKWTYKFDNKRNEKSTSI